MHHLVLTTLLLWRAVTAAVPEGTSCVEQQQGATLASDICNAAAKDMLVSGRGLLQVAGTKPTSFTDSGRGVSTSSALQTSQKLPFGGSWHSLLQSWASRLASKSQIQAHAWLMGPMLLSILALACCLLACSGFAFGFVIRGSRGGVGHHAGGVSANSEQQHRTAQKHARPHSTPKNQQYTIQYTKHQVLCPDLVVPDGNDSILLLNFLEATPGVRSASTLVTDLNNNPIFEASINRPSPGTFPTDPVVVLKAKQRVLISCYLRPGKNAAFLELCSDLGRTARLSVDAGFWGQQWAQHVGNPTISMAYIEGSISDRLQASVRDDSGYLQAEAEPVKDALLRSRVRVYSGIDTGLMLCSLLGMGELTTSSQSRS